MKLLFCLLAVVAAEWINEEATREIFVHDSGIVETKTIFSVRRGMLKDNLPLFLSVPYWNHVGQVTVKVNNNILIVGGQVDLSEIDETKNEAQFAIMPDLVSGGSHVELTTLMGNKLQPFPEAVMELEMQRVLLSSSILIPSRYVTESQITTVSLPPAFNGLENVLPAELARVSGDKRLVFGPFNLEQQKPLIDEAMHIHFGFNKPLSFIGTVKKSIDVSHLGSAVSITESLDLHNGAAKNAGEFNRVPYTHLKFNGASSPFAPDHTLFSIPAIIAGDAANIHYRDVIGNISSSNARRDISPSGAATTRIDIRPRFPLQGGWKSAFDIMYTVPFQGRNVVQQSGDKYFVLSVPLAHAFPTVYAMREEVSLVLPAGVEGVEISVAGRLISDMKTEHKFGWLDTPLLGGGSGQTVVSFSLQGMYASVDDSLKPDLFVKYTLSPLSVYRAPLLLTLYFFIMFAVAIMSRRLNLAITNPKEAKDSEIMNADFDVCEIIDDQTTALSIANATLLEAATLLGSDKPALDAVKKEYIEGIEILTKKVETLCSQFQAEHNKVDRTLRLLLGLNVVRDNGMAVIDAAAAGRDSMPAAQRLIEAEEDIKKLVGRVLRFATATPTTSPGGSGTTTPSGKASSPLQVMKRRKKQ